MPDEKRPAPAGATRNDSAANAGAAECDHIAVDTIRLAAGLLTTISGFVGLIAAAVAFFTDSELPLGLESLFQEPTVARCAVVALSIAAAAGGTLLLRHAHSGSPLTSGTWCAVAAVAARPSVRFNYAEPSSLPLVTFPADGRSLSTMLVFAGAVTLGLLTHTYCRASKLQRAKLYSTFGENLVGGMFLVSGFVAALTFRLDVVTVGHAAYERALLPILAATLLLEVIGFGILAGLAVARALGIAVLIAIAAGALLPDLFLDRLVVQLPLVWAPVCAAAAVLLLVPRRHEHEEFEEEEDVDTKTFERV